MLRSGMRPSFRAEIDELIQVRQCTFRIDLKESVKRALPGCGRIPLIVEFYPEFTFAVVAGIKFFFRLVLDDACEQDFARYGAVSAHQRLKTRCTQDSLAKPSLKAALWPERPRRKLRSGKNGRYHAATPLVP